MTNSYINMSYMNIDIERCVCQWMFLFLCTAQLLACIRGTRTGPGICPNLPASCKQCRARECGFDGSGCSGRFGV